MLIETKIRPPVLKASLIERAALRGRLDAVALGKMAVVTAPAGFGKSTLLGQWAHQLMEDGIAVGWLSVDPQDDDIGRFLEYLVAAINRADPTILNDVTALLQSSPVLPIDTVLTTLANSLTGRQGPLFLVIDDCHHLTHPEIASFLDAFITYAPASFHLVLATRGPVPIKVANMRVRGQMIRLDDTALRFSLAETEDFLNSALALSLAPEDVVFLQHRTEGWIAGLQLASLSLGSPEGRAEFIRRFSGTDRDIADFLLHDVLARLSEHTIDFLVKTSILERFSAGLANAVTGELDAAGMIEEIEAANLFLIPLDHEREWFRYHHLFSELLRSLLARRHPGLVAELHRRAARWLSDFGQTADAVQHALTAGDSDLAADLVEACSMPMIMQSHITRVSEWLNALPEMVIASRPRLQLAQVWILFHMSRARPAAKILKRARDSIRALEQAGRLSDRDRQEFTAELRVLTAGVISAADRSALGARLARSWLVKMPENQHFCKGTLANVLAFCHYSLGNIDEARIACLKARDSHEQDHSVFGVVYSDLILGMTEKDAGNLRLAYEHFTRATRLARDKLGPGSYAEAMVGIFEVEILYEWNDLEGAERLLQMHRQIIEECGLVVHEMTCKLHVARLAAAANRHDEAMAVLERAERQGLQTRYRRLFAIALQERIRLLLERGDLDSARLVLRSRDIHEAWLASPRARHPASEPEHLAFARVLIAEGRPEQALRILSRLADIIRRSRRNRRLVQVRALAAIAALKAGDTLPALDAIAEAVALSAPEGAVRSLLDEGPAIQDVLALGLRRIPSFQPGGMHHDFVSRLMGNRAPIAIDIPRLETARKMPLFSSREAEVARLLCSGKSNRDVATALTMSPDTVKWHLKNIFGKLSVANRTQAVLRLQQLGLGTG